MKKVLLVSVLFLVSTLTFSQCYKSKRNSDRESHFGLVANIGTLKSLGGEIYVKFNNHIIGGGYAREINGAKVVSEEFKNETLYLTYGYQYEKYTFGVRYGKQNKASWIDTTTKEVTSY